MERLRLLYEQIEEAKRLMMSATLPHLRMSLILLDNAAELIMYRELGYRFARDDYYRPTRENLRRGGMEEGPFSLKYTEAERRAAEQEFKPMVKITLLRFRMISEKQATILRVCHEMRKDAFHRGEMNPTILQPLTQLLFLTVAEMAKAFPVHSYSIAAGVPSGENAAFLARFGIRQDELSNENGKDKLFGKLVEGIAFDAFVRQTLSRDLEERIDDTIGGLSYLNNGSSNRGELDHGLRYGQFWRGRGAEIARMADEQNKPPKDSLDEAYREWSENPGPRFTMDKLERWRKEASAIARVKHPADALAKYRAIERRFAPLEEDVSRAVADYDDYINLQI